MPTEFEKRSDQKGHLFELLEVKATNKETNIALERIILKHISEMQQEDVALVIDQIQKLYPNFKQD
ncbi:MAG: hypothetical protein FWF59_11470 [Turicibacter sp.]|nr:hypothetical protein [Turicibacter sp.]